MDNQNEHRENHEFNVPEWETTSRHRGDKQKPVTRQTFRRRATDHFNRAMPAHRKYCGLSRKIACIVCWIIVVVVLVLVIGLAAGLSHRSKYFQGLSVEVIVLTSHQSQKSAPVTTSRISEVHW